MGGFQKDDIKTQEGRQKGTEGAGEGDKENTGGMRRKNKGFCEQQLRKEGGKGRKTQRWMKRGSHRIERGKGFFEVQCSNLSLVPVIVQHLPQLISVKLPPFFPPFPSSLTLTINKGASLIISWATTTHFRLLLLKY